MATKGEVTECPASFTYVNPGWGAEYVCPECGKTIKLTEKQARTCGSRVQVKRHNKRVRAV